MKTLRELLITAAIGGLLVLEMFAAFQFSNMSEKTAAERKVAEQELAIKTREAEIKRTRLQAEQRRLEIENIRFEAFMNGYKNHEYVIEVTQ